ncbi:hypothetical protein PBY51_005068 [Eleginops maclovinus]|uniref:Uncharacterized protein n=1 Tax=Eleginops maclovinus TaxID=56733 RepID=A0AAN8AH21_ELEMC|nr:hypothetical protein PBY51_005068 [Eleginops maclovinus]
MHGHASPHVLVCRSSCHMIADLCWLLPVPGLFFLREKRADISCCDPNPDTRTTEERHTGENNIQSVRYRVHLLAKLWGDDHRRGG